MKKTSATEKMLVLGAQMELETRSVRELYHRPESSGTSPDSVSGPPNRASTFFALYDIFLAYIDSIWWIRCVDPLFVAVIDIETFAPSCCDQIYLHLIANAQTYFNFLLINLCILGIQV